MLDFEKKYMSGGKVFNESDLFNQFIKYCELFKSKIKDDKKDKIRKFN